MPTRTDQDVRRDIEAERERLAAAVESLREEVGEATDISGKLKSKLPLAVGAAASAGFVVAGGVGATARYFARRGREGREQARLGKLSLFKRD